MNQPADTGQYCPPPIQGPERYGPVEWHRSRIDLEGAQPEPRDRTSLGSPNDATEASAALIADGATSFAKAYQTARR